MLNQELATPGMQWSTGGNIGAGSYTAFIWAKFGRELVIENKTGGDMYVALGRTTATAPTEFDVFTIPAGETRTYSGYGGMLIDRATIFSTVAAVPSGVGKNCTIVLFGGE